MTDISIDRGLLNRFESALNPRAIEKSTIPAQVLGYGEISTIFQIGDNKDVAFKRMPLFTNRASAEDYVEKYRFYCNLLVEAGLHLPEDKTIIVEVPGRPVVLYIAQEQLSVDGFCHKSIHNLSLDKVDQLIGQVVSEISKLFNFSRQHSPEIEIALDGQISNWHSGRNSRTLFYIDTSTPLFRKNGIEQLDPELLLKSAPGFLRWIIRWLFLEDVMNRYYDQRQVYLDLAGNLYKEQRPDLIPVALNHINHHLPSDIDPLTQKEVKKYYQEDKIIWTVFLLFRKMDRFIRTNILGKRYEFILPGKIKR